MSVARDVNVLNRAKQALQECTLLNNVDAEVPVLVACSGGRDSMALAWCAAHFLELPVHVAIVNHQLQDGSREVAEQAAKRCKEFGVCEAHILDVDVERTRAGLEADARDARYDVLTHVAHKIHARVVLVAHTSDDVAETILMRLMRSPSLEALTGIAPYVQHDDVMFVRPFLNLTREDTTEICTEKNIDFWDDPTNGADVQGQLDDSYPLRSRIRHDVLPMLSQVAGRDVREVLAHGTARNAEDLAIIEEQVQSAYDAIIRVKNGVHEIKIRPLSKFTPAIARRVIVKVLEKENITPTSAMLSDILQLAQIEQKKKTVRLASMLSANKVYDVIQLWKDR